MLLAVTIDPSWMMLAGIALLVWILMRRVVRQRSGKGTGGTKSRFGKRSKSWHSMPMTSAGKDTHQPLIDAPPELIRWQVDMHDTARELKAELDSKIRIVQTLVGMAREESDRLEANIHQARRLGLPHREATLDQIEQLTREMADEAEASMRPSLATPSRALLEGENPPLHVQREIYRLADLGETSGGISERMGLAVGDVELILATRASR